MDLDAVADGKAVSLRLTFAKDGETVAIEGQEAGHDAGFVVEGRATPSG